MTTELLKVTEGIWAVEGVMKMMPGVYFPVRATVVRLSTGGLCIYSPVNFSDGVTEAIRALGPVEAIVAPNLYHNVYLKPAARKFPEARLFVPEGFSDKVSNLPDHEVLGSRIPDLLRTDFEQETVGGVPRVNETVLFHPTSGSLLVGDYFFNVQEPKGLLTGLMLRSFGTYGRPAQSKLWRRLLADRAAAQASARNILSWDFRRVVMCHGQIVEDGRDFARGTLSYLTATP